MSVVLTYKILNHNNSNACLGQKGIGLLTQYESKKQALRRGKQGLNHVLELFKFLK